MSNDSPILVFLIDDDELFLKSLVIDFKNNSEYIIQTFGTGEQCLKNISKIQTLSF